MRFLWVHYPDILVAFLGTAALSFTVLRLLWRKWFAVALILVPGVGLLGCGLLLRSQNIYQSLPVNVADILGRTAFLDLLLSFAAAGGVAAWSLLPKPKPEHSPERRRFLNATRAVALASPIIATGYGVFIQRDDFHIREVDVPMPGLPKELHGLRLVQLSDIHLSPFLSERELARVIDMANETKPNLALMTGDLITGYRDPLDNCIRQVARLRADAGIIGCLGNHELYARAEAHTTRQSARQGIRILRDQSEVIEFGGHPINFTGVDYQRMREPYLSGAERHVRMGMPNILLSHNPDVFPTAAAKGFDLTISGHTHGGQITVEILHQNLSVARFYTPYVSGLYREGDASVFVTRGIGTVGVPARIGARPEVALIRLCAI